MVEFVANKVWLMIFLLVCSFFRKLRSKIRVIVSCPLKGWRVLGCDDSFFYFYQLPKSDYIRLDKLDKMEITSKQSFLKWSILDAASNDHQVSFLHHSVMRNWESALICDKFSLSKNWLIYAICCHKIVFLSCIV